MNTLKRDGVFRLGAVRAFLAVSLILVSSGVLAHAQTVSVVALSPIANQTVTVGDVATFTASATDSDTETPGIISYGLSAAPSGAAIDSSTGAFSWNTTGTTPNTYNFSVTATGSTGGSDSKNVSIIVNAPPQTQVATSTDGTGGKSSDVGGTITTGDATATSSVDNALNSNTTNPDAPGETNSSTITSTNDNTGELGSAATSTAGTGDNTAVGGGGANTIITGNAVSTANVINEVNTNIFNSSGLILFLNQLFGGGFNINDYDLSYFFAGGPGLSQTTNPTTSATCTLLTCLNSSKLNVINDNAAKVTNSVIVRSSTGANVASSTGDASINTGDAYAAANVVNLVNTNIINSSYLLLSFNNFGNLSENITLPGNDFFQRLFANGEATSSMNSSTYKVNNTNDVNFTGTTTADAATGDNMASTTTADASTTPSGSGVVTTGNAYSSANTYNQANTNNVGGTSVFMLFRVAGNWTGHIIGLPAGITELTMPDGNDQLIEFVSTGATTTPATQQWLQKYNSSQFLASSTNTATVDNNVSVSADTGQNQATTDTGTSTVSTGNAYAAASVVNLINTNIVGQNWIFSLFNIFGNLSGDIVFGGSPNLSLSALTSASNVAPGSDVTYTFDVTNSGSADADNVLLNATFDNTLLSFAPAGQSATSTPVGESWHLGLIPHDGMPHQFSFTAHVGTNFPAGQSATVPLRAAAVNDNITAPSTSNTADASIIVSSPAPVSNNTGSGGGGGGGGVMSSGGMLSSYSADPKLALTKTVSIATTSATTSVDYKVVVTNDKSGGSLYNAYLIDTLTDPLGKVMMQRSWSLDTVAPGDEIDLTYTVVYAATSTPGLYNNVAQITGFKNYSGFAYGTAINPLAATGTVLFTQKGTVVPGTSQGIVLGAATSTPATAPAACSPLLSTFLRRGLGNNAGQVMKLQQFLNIEVGSALPATGVFGPLTEGAVKVFQIKYRGQILAPLGLTTPTGAVLSATQRKINELACGASGLTINSQAASVAAPATAALRASVPRAQTVKTQKVPTKATIAPAASPAAAPKAGLGGWIKSLFSF